MREILFRGKQEEGRWVEGVYFKHDTVKVCFSSDDPKPRHLIIQDGFCDWGFEPPIHCVDVDPETIGQFTGLTDKNGKKIFEGDIVKYKDTDGIKFNGVALTIIGKVAYNEKNASFSIDGKDKIGARHYDYFPIKNIEVIGNIHDNPELLEVTDND